MGQYYMVTILRNYRGVMRAKYYNRYVKPDQKGLDSLMDWNKEEVKQKGYYYTMAKLMEHSYVDNQFVDAITEELIKNGTARVAWVGDYAHLPEEYAKYNPWDREGRVIKYNTPAAEHLLQNKFIVNESKKQYIDFNYYYENSKWEEKWTDAKGKAHSSTWCISPLPILTACGNGLGGGDYRGGNMHMVGSWAFDEIRISDTAPEGYKQICPIFTER